MCAAATGIRVSNSERRHGLCVVRSEEPTLEQRTGVLVGQALDLAAERVDIPTAQTLVATIAWRERRDSVDERVKIRADYDPPSGPPCDDYIVVITDPATGEVDAQGPFTGPDARAVAARVRTELNSTGLSDFTITLTRLRHPSR
jgi:hypothetical protein